MDELVKYKCPICGARYAYKTDFCEVCGWIDDKLQIDNPNLDKGANSISFNKYRCVFHINKDKIWDEESNELYSKNFIVKKIYLTNPSYYNSIKPDKVDMLIKDKKRKLEYPPYKCKICGQYEIEFPHDICKCCGWEDDDLQNDEPDYKGGANQMSLNQYKKFWEENKGKILNSTNTCLTAIDLAKKYYKEHFDKN